jgi:hypothetical protein
MQNIFVYKTKPFQVSPVQQLDEGVFDLQLNFQQLADEKQFTRGNLFTKWSTDQNRGHTIISIGASRKNIIVSVYVYHKPLQSKTNKRITFPHP